MEPVASIHFRIGGGGGGELEIWQKNSARFEHKVAISNSAREARRKNEDCVCFVVFFMLNLMVL